MSDEKKSIKDLLADYGQNLAAYPWTMGQRELIHLLEADILARFDALVAERDAARAEIEGLRAERDHHRQANEALRARNAKLEARNAKLEDALRLIAKSQCPRAAPCSESGDCITEWCDGCVARRALIDAAREAGKGEAERG